MLDRRERESGSMQHSKLKRVTEVSGRGFAMGGGAASVAEGVMGNGVRCQGSRTWHVEVGLLLVHVEHVGARANVDACVLGLDVPNCQDAVEVHGPVGKLPVTLASPHQGVGRWLWWGGGAGNAHKVTRCTHATRPVILV